MTAGATSPGASEAAARAAEDRSWVARIAEGDAEALSRLYDRHAPLLLALALRVLGDAREAEEAVQDTFLQVWRSARGYDPGRSSVATWLVLIGRTRAIDRLRSRRVAERAIEGLARETPAGHASPRAVEDVWMSERRARLRQALAALPAEQRQVLELAYFEGLTQTEVARRTGTPLGTVKTRALLGMKKLRESLRGEIEELLG